jgi:hypothetical protein
VLALASENPEVAQRLEQARRERTAETSEDPDTLQG